MISLRNVTLRRGPHILLENLDWTIYPKQRIGIIGTNGSGKSSLFSLLLGELEVDKGEVSVSSKITFAYVAQETLATEQSAVDYVLDGDCELRFIEKKLASAEQQEDGILIANLHEKLRNIDGYAAKSRAAQILMGLGFSENEIDSPVKNFSGGWRMRLNLAKAMVKRSDVLFLDEPTNHLDLDALVWFEQWLKKYNGTLLLISHDRDFLDETVTEIAYIYQKNVKFYTDNYSAFEKQHAMQLLLQQATYEKQQKKIAHLQSFVDRFRAKASKARQAQSRIKAIERIELVSAVQTKSSFQFEFRSPKTCPNPLIKLEKAAISFGDKCILKDLNLSISPKERIAIVGHNGAGKSSLIKLLAGELKPSQGKKEASPGLKIGYFAQHQVDHLRLKDTPLSHLKDLTENESELDLRKFLGSFDFSGERIFEPVESFSGGEKARLALALIVFERPNLLLLDEPTNHLDLEMRHALNLALQEYEGALLLVTHDRFLVRTTTDQLLLVHNGKLQDFAGDFSDYQHLLTADKNTSFILSADLDRNEVKQEVSRKDQRQIDAKKREILKPFITKVKELEKELEKLQKQFQLIQAKLNDPFLYEAKQSETLQASLISQAKLKNEIEKCEELWLLACDERDQQISS